MRVLIKDNMVLIPKDNKHIKIELEDSEELELEREDALDLKRNPHKLKDIRKKAKMKL
jgi:hypothetical protein